MTIKGLECRDIISDSQCKLLLVGGVDEVTQAFVAHAAQRHASEEDITDRVDAKLQSAVFVSADRAYIGDAYTQRTDGTIAFDGPGVVIQRFFGESVTFEDTGGGTSGGTLTCRCSEGETGDCSITIDGQNAKCTGSSCCAWIIGSHVGPPPPDKVLWEFG